MTDENGSYTDTLRTAEERKLLNDLVQAADRLRSAKKWSRGAEKRLGEARKEASRAYDEVCDAKRAFETAKNNWINPV